MNSNSIKVFFLFLGDIAALYASLFLALVIRYQSEFYAQFRDAHAIPFTIVFALWLAVFYISGLYDFRRVRNNLDFFKTLTIAILVSGLLAVVFFYFLPFSGIAPKTNLFLFLAIFAGIEIIWRGIFNSLTTNGSPAVKVLLIGNDASAAEIYAFTKEHPQLGYEIKRWIQKPVSQEPHWLRAIIVEERINLLVIPRHLKKDEELTRALYDLLSLGIAIQDISQFYETLHKKIPLSELEESWFIENLAKEKSYELTKRTVDILFAIVFGILSLPLWPLIAIGIALSSPGPIIFKQIRVGANQKIYVHYKFRTMTTIHGKAWLDEDKKQITPIGTLLRRTHLDELPQILNLLYGNISLVGPRPDMLDFFNQLKEKIPYYSIRTVVKPGLTGWAQINFPTTTSFEENKERLAYDLYYLKNRSFFLDLIIILKTIKTVVTASGM